METPIKIKKRGKPLTPLDMTPNKEPELKQQYVDVNKITNELGILDNLHDFYEEDKKNKMICFTALTFFLKNKMNFDISILLLRGEMSNKKVRNDYFNAIKSKIKNNGINLNELNDKIIENFNTLFDVNIPEINMNLNNLISDENKILLRQQLYYYIKTNDENMLNFLLRYMNLDIYNGIINCNIKRGIKNNLTKIYYNITYPITYIDDMSSGLNKTYFKYNVLNLDKNKIDQANTLSAKGYFDRVDYSEKINPLIVDKNKTVGIKLDIEYKLLYLGGEFYLENDMIVSKYENIIFKTKKNSVGRDAFGLYDTTLNLLQMSESYFDNYGNDEIKKNIQQYLHNDKNMNNIIDTSNVMDMFERLYSYGKEDGMGCIVFLLFGSKRYGDWVQVHMAKENYFILQTTDFFCKVYAYLYGTPVIFDNTIYNHMVPENLRSLPYKLVDRDETIYRITPENHMIHKSLRTFKTDVDRFYFNKYKKYKYKYHMLRKDLYE
jgi:hypothetical protein